MILIRLLFFALIAFLAYRIYRLMVAPPGAAKDAPERIEGEEMVRCAQCSVHVPRRLALARDAHWYCSAEHRQIHEHSEDGDR